MEEEVKDSGGGGREGSGKGGREVHVEGGRKGSGVRGEVKDLG